MNLHLLSCYFKWNEQKNVGVITEKVESYANPVDSDRFKILSYTEYNFY